MQHSRNNDVGASKTQMLSPATTLNQAEIERLVGRAAGGDYQAFGELYSVYLDRIYLYVCHQVRDKTAAEDITEEIFIKAWEGIKSCKGRESTFLPWLFRVSHNHIIDIYRKQQRELSLQTAVEIDTVADVNDNRLEAEKRQEQQQLLSAIGRLPPNQRQIILLKFIEGLDNQELGQVMHKNQGAIRIMQMRALASLRQIIQQSTEEMY